MFCFPVFVPATQKSITTHTRLHPSKANQQNKSAKRYKLYINVRDYNEIVHRTKLNEQKFIANRTKNHDSKVQWWCESGDEAESEKFSTMKIEMKIVKRTNWANRSNNPQTTIKYENEKEYRISQLTEIDRDFVDHYYYIGSTIWTINRWRYRSTLVQYCSYYCFLFVRNYFCHFYGDCYRLVRPRRRSHD